MVRWVVLYGFCSKFHTLSSNANIWTSVKIWQSYRQLKSGNFLRHSVTECIYTFAHFRGLLPPNGILSGAKFTFRPKSCILLYWLRYCTALQQRPSAKLCSVVQGMELRNFRRWRHLYLVGQPSRLASVHILVIIIMILTNTGSQNPSICFWLMLSTTELRGIPRS